MTEPLKDLVGTTFAGLKVQAVVGTGGSAWVFRAETTEGEPRALKVLRPDGQQAMRRAFETEASVLSRVDHETVVRLVHTHEQDGLRAMELEWLDGTTLADRFREAPFDVVDLLEIWKAASEGLAALHDRGVCHGDIAPSNVMVDDKNSVKLIDFGLSEEKGGVGTLPFLAPELLKTKTAERGPRTDVFAVGACLYTLLSGNFLFWRPKSPPTEEECCRRQATWTTIPIERLRVGLPSSASAAISRALAADPGARQRDAGELARELCTAVDDAHLGRSGASISGGFTQHLAGRMFGD